MSQISKHISFQEATHSDTAVRNAINNTPDAATIEKMKLVAEKCFEPLREWYGKPIRINSFFRSQILNVKVGGSSNSQHCKGEAMDLSAGSRPENKKLYDWCKDNLEFDQLIYEYGDESGPDWVHVSFKAKGNRKQTLRIR